MSSTISIKAALWRADPTDAHSDIVVEPVSLERVRQVRKPGLTVRVSETFGSLIYDGDILVGADPAVVVY